MKIFDNTVKNLHQPIIISDIVKATGLSFSEAEKYAYTLVTEHRGEISSDESGKLIFKFPFGFSKPWEKAQNLRIILDQIKKYTRAISVFLVRSWISIVMVFYVAIFLGIGIVLLVKQKSDRDREDRAQPVNFFLSALFRTLFDSIYWALHPLSPFRTNISFRKPKTNIPFYERVNRFAFGLENKQINPLNNVKILLAEISRKKGKIFLLDVMRVTGLIGKEADSLIVKFVLDYNGNILILADGRLMYFFPDLQEERLPNYTSQSHFDWSKRLQLAPLTGNSLVADMLIIIINLFNLIISITFIQNRITLNKLAAYFYDLPLVDSSLPILFGWIPFCFSMIIVTLPIIRWIFSFSKKKAIATHNIKVRFLLTLLNKMSNNEIKKSVLEKEWVDEFGSKPSPSEFFSIINEFGGEVVLGKNSNDDFCKFSKLN